MQFEKGPSAQHESKQRIWKRNSFYTKRHYHEPLSPGVHHRWAPAIPYTNPVSESNIQSRIFLFLENALMGVFARSTPFQYPMINELSPWFFFSKALCVRWRDYNWWWSGKLWWFRSGSLVEIDYKTNWKADWTAKNDKFNAQYFGYWGLTFLRGYIVSTKSEFSFLPSILHFLSALETRYFVGGQKTLALIKLE